MYWFCHISTWIRHRYTHIFTQICVFPWRYRASLVAQLVKNPPAMWETWVRSLGWEDPLEKGMATHSSILAWRIPWTIQSRGLQRVGHDWVTFTFTFPVFSILIFIIIFLGEAGRYCRKQSRLWLPFLQLSSLRFSTCKMRMMMLIQLAHLVWI